MFNKFNKGEKIRKNKEDIEIKEIERRRRTKVTKGGRRFNVSVLTLVSNNNDNSISSGYSKSKEAINAFKKSVKKAKKTMINYFPEKTATIPHDIMIKYKSVKILIRPSAPGSGIKAGGILRFFFKMLSIKDVSAKIIGRSQNKANTVKAIFMAMDKLTGKKYKNY